MRCRKQPIKRRTFMQIYLAAALCLTVWAVWQFSRYVNTTIKPTLHQLAEYEARAATAQAIQSAVSSQLQADPALCEALYIRRGKLIQLDAARANAAKAQLLDAVQQNLAAMPETAYYIPFGSLTNNSLLSGLGPGWAFSLRPQGYVQGEIRETTQSLSINTTRYSAVLELTVTVNMVLDGRTATLTVTDTVPLASVLLCGDIPSAYASNFD